MRFTKVLLPLAAALCMPLAAHAGIPFLNATCPGNIEVHADKGGPVYINGKEAALKKYNNNAFEAKRHGITVAITINPDGSPMLTYTGKHGANGVCQLTDGMPAAAASAPASSRERVSIENMASYCVGEASAKFHERPQYIKTQPVKRDHGMFTVLGRIPDSNLNFACTFNKDGELVGVDKI